jgi:NarL family two-component system response regulator LiaR
MPPITLLIVDDHSFFRRGLRQVCEQEQDFLVVGEAANGREAVEQARALQPDLILMDLTMPELDGIGATSEISGALPGCKVIMLTVQQQDQAVFAAIKAGAQGYLLKDVAETQLVGAIRGVMRGESLINPQLASRIIDEFRRLSLGAPSDPRPGALLSEGEFAVLRLVAQGLENAEIADQLGLTERTVTNRLSAIYEKLHVNNRTQAALYALRRRWVSLD